MLDTADETTRYRGFRSSGYVQDRDHRACRQPRCSLARVSVLLYPAADPSIAAASKVW